jgi:hypothetical protein
MKKRTVITQFGLCLGKARYAATFVADVDAARQVFL